MDTMTILTAIGGVMLSVIGFFLKQTMSELKEVKQTAYTTATKLEVLETDYRIQLNHLNDKIDDLTDSIGSLTSEIRSLNEKLRA